MKTLTKKQEAFTKHYVGNPKASVTDSVIAAGYSIENRQMASVIGSQLLKNTKVRSAISEVIQGGQYDERIKEVWNEAFETGSFQDKFKAIDQIVKIGGLEAPKRVDKREMKVSGSVEDLLPKIRRVSSYNRED